MDQFKKTVEGLVLACREMIAASKLLRGRIESNDDVLLRIENTQRGIADRLDDLDRRVTMIQNMAQNRTTAQWYREIITRLDTLDVFMAEHGGDFPSVIP